MRSSSHVQMLLSFYWPKLDELRKQPDKKAELLETELAYYKAQVLQVSEKIMVLQQENRALKSHFKIEEKSIPSSGKENDLPQDASLEMVRQKMDQLIEEQIRLVRENIHLKQQNNLPSDQPFVAPERNMEAIDNFEEFDDIELGLPGASKKQTDYYYRTVLSDLSANQPEQPVDLESGQHFRW